MQYQCGWCGVYSEVCHDGLPGGWSEVEAPRCSVTLCHECFRNDHRLTAARKFVWLQSNETERRIILSDRARACSSSGGGYNSEVHAWNMKLEASLARARQDLGAALLRERRIEQAGGTPWINQSTAVHIERLYHRLSDTERELRERIADLEAVRGEVARLTTEGITPPVIAKRRGLFG